MSRMPANTSLKTLAPRIGVAADEAVVGDDRLTLDVRRGGDEHGDLLRRDGVGCRAGRYHADGRRRSAGSTVRPAKGVRMSDWHRLRYDIWSGGYDCFVRASYIVSRRADARSTLLGLRPGSELLIDGCGTGLDFALPPRRRQAHRVRPEPQHGRATPGRGGASARARGAHRGRRRERLPYRRRELRRRRPAPDRRHRRATAGGACARRRACCGRAAGSPCSTSSSPATSAARPRRAALLNVPSRLLFTDLTRLPRGRSSPRRRSPSSTRSRRCSAASSASLCAMRPSRRSPLPVVPYTGHAERGRANR